MKIRALALALALALAAPAAAAMAAPAARPAVTRTVTGTGLLAPGIPGVPVGIRVTGFRAALYRMGQGAQSWWCWRILPGRFVCANANLDPHLPLFPVTGQDQLLQSLRRGYGCTGGRPPGWLCAQP